MTERETRLRCANELLKCIAANGRRFFHHEGRTSEFFMRNGRLFLRDKWRGGEVYMHREAHGREFTEGGTLWGLCRALKRFIWDGTQLPERILGPWPEWLCSGDLWGYGAEAMSVVRLEARMLGILPVAPLPSAEESGSPRWPGQPGGVGG